MAKSIVFLTHRAAEHVMAKAIKDAIEDAFTGVDVFLSSDPENIGAGDPWVRSIETKLEVCEAQIILASPISLSRPWVHLEVGARWNKVPQIPLCHSGQEPGRLPIPLSLLQGGKVNDEDFLKSVFAKIAKVADQRVPAVDFTALAERLGQIEAGYLAAVEPEQLAETAVARAVGPEMRRLSDDRQRLETQLFGAILRWNTLRATGASGDPARTLQAIEVANAFWADPKSLVRDDEVANARAVIETSIADLEASAGVEKPVRTLLLRAVREMSHAQDATSRILTFDLREFATTANIIPEHASRALRDLLTEDLVEPYEATQGIGPMGGEVRITAAGLSELRRLGEADY